MYVGVAVTTGVRRGGGVAWGGCVREREGPLLCDGKKRKLPFVVFSPNFLAEFLNRRYSTVL